MKSKLVFVEDSIIEVFEIADFEFDNPIEIKFSQGEEIDVFIHFEDKHNYQVELKDGSTGIVPTDFVKKVS